MIMMSLSLSWICYRDRLSFFVKFGLKKKFKWLKNNEFEFKLDLLERYSFTPC